MKISKFRTTTEEKKKELDSQQLDASGPFDSPVWFKQPEQRLTILQSQQEGALWELSIAARNAGNRQFLVFYTTADTVQFRTEDTGGERQSGGTSQACDTDLDREGPPEPAEGPGGVRSNIAAEKGSEENSIHQQLHHIEWTQGESQICKPSSQCF